MEHFSNLIPLQYLGLLAVPLVPRLVREEERQSLQNFWWCVTVPLPVVPVNTGSWPTVFPFSSTLMPTDRGWLGSSRWRQLWATTLPSTCLILPGELATLSRLKTFFLLSLNQA